MTKLVINIGQSANDKNGDPLRTAFDKVNQNFTEIYTALANGTNFSQVNADWNASSGVASILNKPTIPTNTNQLTNGAGFITSTSSLVNGQLAVELDTSGTINTPLLIPLNFTAILDTAHMHPQPGVALSGTPWELEVGFQVNPNSAVTTYINQIFPRLDNPGYVSGYVFRFTEVDHGIPGYIFDVTLNDVVFSGGVHWTANIAVTAPPEYPSTIFSAGALKLTSNTYSFILGTDGKLTIPLNGDIVDSNGNSVINVIDGGEA